MTPTKSDSLLPTNEPKGGIISVVNATGGETSAKDPRWPSLSRWTEKLLHSPASANLKLATASTVPSLAEGDTSTEMEALVDPAVINLHKSVEVHSSHIVKESDLNHNQNSIQSPPLQGAWSKKLIFSNASTSQQDFGKLKASSDIWPSLSVSKNQQQRHGMKNLQKPVAMEDDIRFPWAAKMNPISRNLYRAAEPEYLEDGTPKVTIPQHVFLQGVDNQKEYIIGQFYRCSLPSGGLIYAVFNKLWGRNCRITIRKLGESSYLFHIPDESTRIWVLQRGLWHVDDCLMFVAPWTPKASLAIPEIKTIPVWVTLKKIPNILYSIPGISHIASGLGAPMATYKPRLDPILMGEAKILVEVELSKAFPSRIAADDENGFISMVDVEYAWLPSKCERCGQLGHKVKRCLQAASESHIVDTNVAEIVSKDSILVTTNSPDTLSKSAQAKATSAPIPRIEVSPPNILFDASNESNSIGSNIIDTTDDLISLATISVLENMASQSPPSFVCINETIESSISESARILTVSDTSIAQVNSTSEKESSSIVVVDFGSNKFGSLVSLEEEEYSTDSDKESDSMDLMTPSGKRILRERPVKPSTKAKEMHLQSTGRGRGNRGRGNRGGRG